jgi:hypothetical protein
MLDNMISIQFEINGYRDALHIPIDNTFTEAEIEAMKQARYDNWYAHINGMAIGDQIVALAAPEVPLENN